MVKLGVVLTLLALLGSASCQVDNGGASPPMLFPSTQNMPTHPPSPSPSSPNTFAYPPSQEQPGYPGASPSQFTFPPPGAASPSPSPLAYPPSMGPTPPSESSATSPEEASVPAYPPSQEQEQPASPEASPSQLTYPPGASPSQLPFPPSSAASPSRIPTPDAYPPSPSPSSSSPSPHAFPPTPSSPTYPPSPVPQSPSPAAYPPNPSPPTYPPSPSPSPAPIPPTPGLSVGHYKRSCPNAEGIVREAVKNAIDGNRGTGAGLIRLFFHDCFVRGCDASVLLNTTGSDEPTERLGAPNLTLRGFEVIDAAKAALEEACPGVVSCADILAFAGRDATYLLSGPAAAVDFDMPAGRYDGRVSLAGETIPNLPAPFFGLPELAASFGAKGLSLEDMVTLSGAHSVGRSRCSSFSDRLQSNASDMDPELRSDLVERCNKTGEPTAEQDSRTPDDLDAQYYRNVESREVLFGSDAALMASNETASMVLANAYVAGLWESRFAAAMVKMGAVGVKTRADGEIRKKCWIIN